MDEEEIRETRILNRVISGTKYIELDKLKKFYEDELKNILDNSFIDEFSVIADLKEFIDEEEKQNG